jgi:sec-independent protein translocase protein TatC
MKVGLVASCILAAPWILYQLWQFVATGLYPSERKCVHILVPFSAAMSLLGLTFSYYIILPVSAVFFVNFSANFPVHDATANAVTETLSHIGTNADLGGEKVAHDARKKPTLFDANPAKFPILKEDPKEPKAGEAWIQAETGNLKIATADRYVVTVRATPDRMLSAYPSLEEWVNFAAFTTLGIVAIFQIPVIMLVLGWTRIVSPDLLSKNRKFVIFGCAAVAAIVAPPDIVSMLVLGLPVYLLFEFGLLLMRWVYNKRQREAEDNLEGDDDLG